MKEIFEIWYREISPDRRPHVADLRELLVRLKIAGYLNCQKSRPSTGVVEWVQEYVTQKMRSEVQPFACSDMKNHNWQEGFRAGRWAMMQELAAEECSRLVANKEAGE